MWGGGLAGTHLHLMFFVKINDTFLSKLKQCRNHGNRIEIGKKTKKKQKTKNKKKQQQRKRED
jgi:hypothetical protein